MSGNFELEALDQSEALVVCRPDGQRLRPALSASGRVPVQPGDVIVVEAGDDAMAVAGGNVCAVAQKRGVAGFVVDGVIRDIGESRANGFPLFACGREPGKETRLVSHMAAARSGEFHLDHIAIPPDDAEGSDGRYLDPLATLAYGSLRKTPAPTQTQVGHFSTGASGPLFDRR